MQFEQQAELNRYVDLTIPLNWAIRWRAVKPAIPMLVCCSLLFVEQIAFRLWLNDKSLILELPLLLVCSVLPIGLVMVAFELQVRVRHRSKRTIKLEPKRVLINPAKYNRISWNQAKVWRFEPLAVAPGLCKMTLEYSLSKKSKLHREWSMVLRRSDQEHAFSSELEHFRQMGPNAAQVVRIFEPLSPTTSKRRLRSMVAVAFGLYLLLHGLPLFGVGLLPPTKHSDRPQSESQFTAKESAKLRRTVARSFTSPQQFRQFLLVLGGGLTTLGAGLYFWGLSTPRQSDEVAVGKSPPTARFDAVVQAK